MKNATQEPEQRLHVLLDNLDGFTYRLQQQKLDRVRLLVDQARRDPKLGPKVRAQVHHTTALIAQHERYARQALRLLRAYCNQPDPRLLVQAEQLVELTQH